MKVSVSGALDAVGDDYGTSVEAVSSASGKDYIQAVFAAQVGDVNPVNSAVTDKLSPTDLADIGWGSTATTAQYQKARLTMKNSANVPKTVNFRALNHSVMNPGQSTINLSNILLTNIRDKYRVASGDATYKIVSANWL